MTTSMHITLTDFRNESRVEKEAASILDAKLADQIIVMARSGDGLPIVERRDGRLIVRRLKLHTGRLPKSAAFQALKLLEFMLRCWLAALKGRPKHVSLHSYALLPLGCLIKLTTSAALIYDAHELETEVEGLKGARKKLAKWIERCCIQYCDIVVVVSDPIAEWYTDAYPNVSPIVVRNCPHRTEMFQSRHFHELYKLPKETTLFLYQGLLGPGRGLELITDIFAKDPPPGSALILMGYGSLEADLQNIANRAENIYLHPAVPSNELLHYTSAADIGLCLIQPSCLSYDYCLPNKLFEYLSQGLNVLMSNLTAMRAFSKLHQVGVLVDVADSDSVRSSIHRIAKQSNKENVEKISQVMDIYNWQTEAEKLLSAYRQVEGTRA